MGFNNGYDSGWHDAIQAVRDGRVEGLGVAAGGAAGGGGGDAASETADTDPRLYVVDVDISDVDAYVYKITGFGSGTISAKMTLANPEDWTEGFNLTFSGDMPEGVRTGRDYLLVNAVCAENSATFFPIWTGNSELLPTGWSGSNGGALLLKKDGGAIGEVALLSAY